VAIVLFVAGAGAVVAAAELSDRSVKAPASPFERTVKVSAMSEIDVVPDEAVLSLSVTTSDEKDLLRAKAENDKRTRAVLQSIRAQGIADKWVKLSSLQIRPEHERSMRQMVKSELGLSNREVLQYSVDRGIDVTLDNFGILEAVLSGSLKAGATSINSVLFRTKKHREHQFETRRLAVTYAKEKAGHLAELNGLTLGKAIEIEEEVEGDMHTFGGGMGMGGMGENAQNEVRGAKVLLVSAQDKNRISKKDEQPAGDANVENTIPPGQITIRAIVTITFELKEPK
jgi:uncharacterized protein YggE